MRLLRRGPIYRALAERVGFEPTRACTLPLFESGTFDHSDISPRRSIAYLSTYGKHNSTLGVYELVVGNRASVLGRQGQEAPRFSRAGMLKAHAHHLAAV